jgi:hypothetical protein
VGNVVPGAGGQLAGNVVNGDHTPRPQSLLNSSKIEMSLTDNAYMLETS